MTTKHVADAGAALTSVGAIVTWAAVETALRIGAALITIGVGVMTFLYYYEAWKEKRRQRRSLLK